MKRRLFFILSVFCLSIAFLFMAEGMVSAGADTLTLPTETAMTGHDPDISPEQSKWSTASPLSVPAGKSVTVNYSAGDMPYQVTSSDESILKVSLVQGDYDSRSARYHYKITYTGVSRGKVTVTENCHPYYGHDGITKREVTVFAPVENITLDRTKATLTRKATDKNPILKLTAAVSPSSADNLSVEWSSNDSSVASVSADGEVTAHKKGKAVITCQAVDGSGVTAECKIIVEDLQVSKIVLSAKKATIKTGKKLQLKVKKIKPLAALNQKVKWTTSNKKVAVVNKNGLVTAKGPGKCVITCTAKDGSGKKATCKITVK